MREARSAGVGGKERWILGLDAGSDAGSVGGEPWCLVNIGVAVVVEAVERRRRGMRASIVGWLVVGSMDRPEMDGGVWSAYI